MPREDPTQIAKAGKRRSKGRSKLGCLTCREKHVKCDERLPVCRRCERLKLSCSPHWTQKPRSYLGTSSSPSSPLQTLRPRKPVMAACESEPRVQGDISWHADTELLEWTTIDGIYSGATSALFSGAIALSHSPPGAVETMPVWGHSHTSEPHIPTNGWSLVTEDRMSSVATTPWTQSIPVNTYLEPCSSHTHSLGRGEYDDLILGHEERKALRHYQDGFCVVHTSKTAAWSFPILLLHKTSYSSIVVRYAVAVSLQDLELRRHVDGLPRSGSGRASMLAYSHFSRATSALREAMRECVKPIDHFEALASIYFHYVYLTHQPTIDKAELQRLSRTTVRYFQTSSIFEVLTESVEASSTSTAMAPSTRSFLCRLLLWVYREDVYAMGYRCAGEAARYISKRPKLVRRLCTISRAALQLNWGTLYPTEQRLDDVFSSQHLDMLVRMIQLQFDITEFGWSMMASDASTETISSQSTADIKAKIEDKMDLIETDFAPTFQMITMPDETFPTSTSDLFQSAAVFVTIYYAWKVIYYQCAGAGDERIQAVLALLMHSAQHTTLKIQLKDLQRALLAAVLEIRDPIHKDWILEKIGYRWRDVLRTAQSIHGKRVNIWTIYELVSDNGGVQ